MKRAVLLFTVLILSACQQKIEEQDIAKLNGYWEIEKVILADGSEKDYKINETIDYLEIKNDSGFRKKVMPQFDGKYLVNNQSEKVKVIFKNGKTFLEYKTDYIKWQDEILKISDDKLTLKNSQGISYQYKKPIPFSLK
ncbi:lipocalin family protein [Flavobacterium sp. 3HN19-14]|uniref:lipocalin family protein n=1 Tax=Flavobacterium sp. 3HN19-14 TaxID=3448133 RepID=UPI003EE3B8F9